MNKHLAAAAAAIAMAVSLPNSASAGGRPDLVLSALASRPHATGQLLVQFRHDAGAAAQADALRRVGGQRLETVAAQRAGGRLDLVRVPTGIALASAIRALGAHPAVEFAEPNWVYQHAVTANDTYYANGSLWGMYGAGTSPANAYGSGAAGAWAAGHTCDASIYVGIIDEGFMYGHEDLAANAWTNPYDPANGVDDDGNGYVDDVHGWDFDANDSSTFDGVTDDHGTHVAGTIAGVGGNGKGVAGVCWSAKLVSAKFLGRRGGTTANAIKAVDYITGLKTRHGLNVVATNNSWGGGGFSQGLADAIERANAAGILFIAAAGNETNDNDANASYPAAYDNANIIAVAALTSTGGLASYSNWGASTVDIGAPGSGIYSSVPKSVKGAIVSGYASYSGTSMATPHVTGAAALYASTHPGATPAQIRAAILGAAVPTPSLAGKVATGGRLNASGF